MSNTGEYTMNSENEETPMRFRGNCFLALAKQTMLLKIVRHAQTKEVLVESLSQEEMREVILA